MPRHLPTLLHVDLDAFFASVEERDKPSIRGRPVVVGGVGPRGVVATCNYLARAAGVRSAMPTSHARRILGAKAVYLQPRHHVYQQASTAVMSILAEVSACIEQVGLDEAYLDLAARADQPSSIEDVRGIAGGIAERVRIETRLPVSIGAAGDMTSAKLASKAAKPQGVVVVPVEDTLDFLAAKPVGSLWGVGPRTEERLDLLGVRTIGDLLTVAKEELERALGSRAARVLMLQASGEDPRQVALRGVPKAVSREGTFDPDSSDPSHVITTLKEFTRDIAAKLKESQLAGSSVTVRVMTSGGAQIAVSRKLGGPSRSVDALEGAVMALVQSMLRDDTVLLGVRRCGVSITGISRFEQPDLFEAEQTPREPTTLSRPGPDAVWRPQGPAYPWHLGEDIVHADYGEGWVREIEEETLVIVMETETSRGPGRVLEVARGSRAIMPKRLALPMGVGTVEMSR